jgi:hypothetical protein
LPVGLQLIGDYFAEDRLLNVAHRYQQATDWHRARPPPSPDVQFARFRLMEWETVIGLEIHAQLATKSKIFSGASTAYGARPTPRLAPSISECRACCRC